MTKDLDSIRAIHAHIDAAIDLLRDFGDDMRKVELRASLHVSEAAAKTFESKLAIEAGELDLPPDK